MPRRGKHSAVPIPQEDYLRLTSAADRINATLAEEGKVSVSWLVRHTTRQFVEWIESAEEDELREVARDLLAASRRESRG